MQESKLILEQIDKYKSKFESQDRNVQLLTDENQRLGLRAAVGFDELTPRYGKFPDTFKELGITAPKADYKVSTCVSSIAYIQGLINAYRGLKFPVKNMEPIQNPGS